MYVTGASGTGKTAISQQLLGLLDEFVVMDSDIFLSPAYLNETDGTMKYRDYCLRVCKNIMQGRRPVALCGSALPQEYEQCVERRYFSALHCLARGMQPGGAKKTPALPATVAEHKR